MTSNSFIFYLSYHYMLTRFSNKRTVLRLKFLQCVCDSKYSYQSVDFCLQIQKKNLFIKLWSFYIIITYKSFQDLYES